MTKTTVQNKTAAAALLVLSGSKPSSKHTLSTLRNRKAQERTEAILRIIAQEYPSLLEIAGDLPTSIAPEFDRLVRMFCIENNKIALTPRCYKHIGAKVCNILITALNARKGSKYPPRNDSFWGTLSLASAAPPMTSAAPALSLTSTTPAILAVASAAPSVESAVPTL